MTNATGWYNHQPLIKREIEQYRLEQRPEIYIESILWILSSGLQVSARVGEAIKRGRGGRGEDFFILQNI